MDKARDDAWAPPLAEGNDGEKDGEGDASTPAAAAAAEARSASLEPSCFVLFASVARSMLTSSPPVALLPLPVMLIL